MAASELRAPSATVRRGSTSTVLPPSATARHAVWVTRVRRSVAQLWGGPAGLLTSLMLEWRLVAARWVGIVTVGPALLLLNLSPERLAAACGILLLAVVYNSALQLLLPRRPTLFASGYVTTAADSILNIGMVLVAGGFDSPLSYMLFTVTMAVAMRYGYGPALAMTVLFAGGELLEKAATGRSIDAAFAFRTGFLVITALLASYLRHLAAAAEAALQERLVEVHALYRDLALAHQELLSVDQMKTSFLANVSHELRTPLTSIKGYIDLMLDGDAGPLTDDQTGFLEVVRANTNREVTLVNQVIAISAIHAGRLVLDRSPVCLAEVLDGVGRTVAPLAAKRDQQVVLELAADLPAITADPLRLAEILENVLSNACKFSPFGGRVVVGAHAEPERVVVEVHDAGRGMEGDQLARLFSPFGRAGTEDHLAGIGLGLAITRGLVEAHGGSIGAISTPGIGTTVTISLPRAA